MKESNNTDTSGKIQSPPPTGGVGENIPAYNQQLPIKDKAARQQAQALIEKKGNRYERLSFQNKIPVPA
jgi:hypothetical protein